MKCDLILNLANSLWFVNHRKIEVLNDEKWINENLNHTKDPLTNNLSSDFVMSLTNIRSIIIKIFEGDEIENHIDFLNMCLEKSQFYNKLSVIEGKANIEMISTTTVTDQLIANIIIELIESIDYELIPKIRKCGVPDCQFYFLDKSKNQNKKYCSIKCNNVAKVRRFREKNKN